MSTPEFELDGLLGDEDLVRRIARGLLFDEHEVDDVVQQTWMAAMRRPPSGVASRRAWLATVARNAARNHGRGEGRRRSREQLPVVEPPRELPSAEAIFAREESRRRVVDAVRKLDEPYRTTILLRYFEGLPPRKIAKRLGVKRDTIATRLKRGLNQLRQRLDGDFGDRRAWALALIPLAAPTTTAAVLTTKAIAISGALLTMKNIIAGAFLVLLIVLGIALGSNPDDGTPSKASSPSTSGMSGSMEFDETDAPTDGTPIPSVPYSEQAPPTGPTDDASPSAVAALGGFRGRLVDPLGRPAPDQIVRLMSMDLMAAFGSTSDPMGKAGAAGVRSAEVRTADDGTFVIRRVVPGSMHALHAGLEGPHPTFKLLGRSVAPGETVDLGDVRLETLASVEGVVVDESGSPVEGAHVWAADLPPLAMQVAPFDRLVADGALLLGLPTVDPATVPDAASWHSHLRKHLAKNVVTADRGAPFVVLEFPKWTRELLASLPRSEATTDAEGRFRLDGVPLGRVSVIARAAGRTTGKRSVRTAEGLVANAGALTVKPGQRLEARVVDGEGNGVADAEVRVAVRPLFGLTGLLFAGAARTTDVDGKVVVPGLPSGRVQVAYRSQGALTWTVTQPVSSRKPIDLPLPSETSASFVVKSATGQPLQGLKLRLQQGPPLAEFAQAGMAARRDLDVGSLKQSTTEDGATRFTLTGLAEGVHTVLMLADGYAFTCGTIRSVRPETETEDAVFVLSPASKLSIRVQDEDGKPVHGAHCFAQEPGNPGWARSLLWSYAGLRGWNTLGRDVGHTDVNGFVAGRGLPAGEGLYVTVRHPAYGTETLFVEPDAEEAVVTLVSPGAIVGRIWDHGMPADPTKWRIVAERDEVPDGSSAPAMPHQTQLDADGKFRLDGLAPGIWRVEVVEAFPRHQSLGVMSTEIIGGINWINTDKSQEILVTSGAEIEMALDLDPSRLPPGSMGCRLTGRVLIDGKPEAAIVRVGGNAFVRTNDEGEFVVEGFRGGNLLVTVSTPDLQIVWWRDQLMFAPDQHRVHDVDVGTTVLEVEVFDPAGAVVADHTVGYGGRWADGGQLESSMRRTKALTRVRVPAQRGNLLVQGPRGRAVKEVSPVPGATQRVRVDLSASGVLSGTIDTRGEDFALVYARTLVDGSENIRATLVRNGGFHFTNLPSGTYRVTIELDDVHYTTRPETIEVGEKGAIGVELTVGDIMR